MQITKYLRKALAAQISPRINFKNDNPYISDINQISKGKGFNEYFNKLVEESNLRRSSKELPKTEFEILIALKTILTQFDEGVCDTQQPDELTCVFFVPAKLCKGGVLTQNEGKLPWFVREFMQPMVEPELSIGNAEDVDAFLSQTAAERCKIQSWEEYWDYICSMYQTITHTDISDLSIPNMPKMQFDSRCYIVQDNTVAASRNILKLYNAILEMSSVEEFPLYQTLTSLKEATSRPLVKDSPEAMMNHSGQMGSAYPLSESQRESLNHLNLLANGEILAVSGPPGTGKTTLLQSVVADLVTKRALEKENAPIIVASSTNNPAVTNIIDSFSQFKPKSPSGLDSRWITAANSFATYFPSFSKKEKSKKYQTDEEMIKVINQPDTRKESRKKMLHSCEIFFERSIDALSDCEATIYYELTKNEELKCRLLEKHAAMMELTCDVPANTFFQNIALETQEVEHQKHQTELLKENKLNERKMLCSRMKEWEFSFKSQISWAVRLFGFIPSFEKRIIQWTQTFKSEDEIVNAQSAQTPREMMAFYQNQIEIVDNDIRELLEKISEYDSQINCLNARAGKVKDSLSETIMVCNEIKKLTAYVPPKKNGLTVSIDIFISESTMREITEYMDVSLRWRSFWLAVHYYECIWLETQPISEDDIWKTTRTILEEKHRQLAMLSPCFVMTFYMLPSKMKTYNDIFLMNHIDLLVVDEAGQTSPEVAAASFALAKKAIVVGDEYQISPVWGLCRSLDIAIAIECGVIQNQEDFALLEKRGLNASQSSVMKLALGSCPYNKFDKGLFLSEHRRCYNEIIGYCNDLVYQKRLQPLRGSGKRDSKRPEIMKTYPIIGYHDIPIPYSEKVGSSRKNATEAKEIAQWVESHFEELYNAYKNVDEKTQREEVIAIITPFKSQANEIKAQLRKVFASQTVPIDVGTVHTFQGAERKIIIFSTTYGSSESGYFINKNSHLMNVAVSRAKDAFWVFGSIDCLKGDNKMSAKELLYQYVREFEF